MFDFSKIDSAKEVKKLQPGCYVLAPTAVELNKEGKTPRLVITFSGEAGEFKENFFLSEKAMARLQYFHENWWGKRLEKAFSSLEEIHAYFEKLVSAKHVPRTVIVGGREYVYNGEVRVGVNMPYTGFILREGSEVDLGPFEPNSVLYNRFMQRIDRSILSTNDTVLSGGDDSAPSTPKADLEDDDLPF